MLKNEYSLAKIGADTAENGSPEDLNRAERSGTRRKMWRVSLRGPCRSGQAPGAHAPRGRQRRRDSSPDFRSARAPLGFDMIVERVCGSLASDGTSSQISSSSARFFLSTQLSANVFWLETITGKVARLLRYFSISDIVDQSPASVLAHRAAKSRVQLAFHSAAG